MSSVRPALVFLQTAVISILAALAILAARDASAAKIARVEGDTVEMRAGPGTKYDSVGNVTQGDYVTIANIPIDGYYKARTVGGVVGWISTESLNLNPPEPAPLPTIQSVPGTEGAPPSDETPAKPNEQVQGGGDLVPVPAPPAPSRPTPRAPTPPPIAGEQVQGGGDLVPVPVPPAPAPPAARPPVAAPLHPNEQVQGGGELVPEKPPSPPPTAAIPPTAPPPSPPAAAPVPPPPVAEKSIGGGELVPESAPPPPSVESSPEPVIAPASPPPPTGESVASGFVRRQRHEPVPHPWVLRLFADENFYQAGDVNQILGVQDFNGGLGVGGELEYSLSQFLAIVGRVEAISTSTTFDSPAVGPAEASLHSYPVMLGAKFRLSQGKDIETSFSIYQGFALSTELKTRVPALAFPNEATLHSDSMTFMAQFALEMALTERWSFFVEGGYRGLKTASLVPGEKSGGTGLLSANGTLIPISIDMSGPIGGAGIQARF